MIVTSYKQMELTPADVWNFAGLIGFAVHTYCKEYTCISEALD